MSSECPICYDEKCLSSVQCGHEFCMDCLHLLYDGEVCSPDTKRPCPLCRHPILYSELDIIPLVTRTSWISTEWLDNFDFDDDVIIVDDIVDDIVSLTIDPRRYMAGGIIELPSLTTIIELPSLTTIIEHPILTTRTHNRYGSEYNRPKAGKHSLHKNRGKNHKSTAR